MAHINHAAIGNMAVFRKFIGDLRGLGDDLEITVLSSYLSAPFKKVLPTLGVISTSLQALCFPVFFERNAQGVKTIFDNQQLSWDQVRDIAGETSGGLTVLFNTETGKVQTDITKISLDEKMRRVA